MAASRRSIIQAVKALAAKTKGPLTIARARNAGIDQSAIYYWFPRGWLEVLREAGLLKRAARGPTTTDHALMCTLHRLAVKLGRLPRRCEFERNADRSYATYAKRFGPHPAVLRAYGTWLRAHSLPQPHEPAARTAPVPQPLPTPHPPARACIGARSREHWIARRQAYGRPIGLRGIAHEPVSELGVIHLAGVLWQEIGLVIVRMRDTFPDCEAWRRFAPGSDAWQRVRVEFEFRSSQFKRHRHNVDGCDLIVCWEHDWPECPLEVVELKAIVLSATSIIDLAGAPPSGQRERSDSVRREWAGSRRKSTRSWKRPGFRLVDAAPRSRVPTRRHHAV